MAESAYASLTDIQRTFKLLLWGPFLKWVKLSAQGALPFLAWPVISTIFNGVVDYVSEKIFQGFILFVDVSAIKLKNAEHQSAYDKSSLRLKIIAHEKGADSNEYKDALAKALDAMSAFTQFGR